MPGIARKRWGLSLQALNQVIHGAIDFLDPEAPASQMRFYRAVPEETGQ